MLHYLRRWRLPFIALLAAFAVCMVSGTQAFAAESGESNQFQTEIWNNNSVQSQDTMSEATSPVGTLVQVEGGISITTCESP